MSITGREAQRILTQRREDFFRSRAESILLDVKIIELENRFSDCPLRFAALREIT